MLFFFGIASAQGTKTVAIKVSQQTQTVNNKEYYVHVVEQGQTVFSIARAYGLKYYDAVIKTDIHMLKVGDTVWLPKNQYSVAAVSDAASATVSSSSRIHYIKIEAGQTLYSLAREYGVSVEQIIELNPELKTEQLKAGQMIKIPPRQSSTQTSTSVTTAKKEYDKSNLKQNSVAEQVAEDRLKEIERRRQEEMRVKEELQRQEEARKHEEARRLEEAQKREELAKQQEQQRLEQQRLAEQQKHVEQQRKQEEARQQEEARKNVLAQDNTSSKSADNTINVEPKTNAEPKVDAEPNNVAEHKSIVERVVVNPYPFAEIPDNFPTQKAGFISANESSSFNYQVRDRQSKNEVFVSVVMPLNLDKINEISTSKFDIEQRGKKDYKVFEFIQFYEGILMALDQLQQQGYNVTLNVVDLVSDKEEDVVEAFYSHNVANSDLIIALLVKKPFTKLAELAQKNQVFVINPFSSRSDVVKDNPYVVKYMPSYEGTVKGMLDIVARKHPHGHLYLLHSNNRNSQSEERAFFDEFQRQLEQRKEITYTLFDWAANAKLISSMKSTDDNVIISIYDQDKNRNTVFATTLLNRLSSLSTHVPVLMTCTSFLTEYPNVDFEQLQHLNYTTVTLGYLDYDNPKHKEFINTYKEKFRTEPNTLYAGVAHDITLYFVTALSQRGASFWQNPQQFIPPEGMLFPFSLKQSSSTGGYENQSPDIYQMLNFKLIPLSK